MVVSGSGVLGREIVQTVQGNNPFFLLVEGATLPSHSTGQEYFGNSLWLRIMLASCGAGNSKVNATEEHTGYCNRGDVVMALAQAGISTVLFRRKVRW